jgi:predicted  nucleic acid-binding Zn-ribbon protein
MAGDQRLLQLQALDLRIERARARAGALEAGEDLTRARAAADAAERELGELRLQLDAFDRDGARLEHEIDSLQQKMAAEQHRQYDGTVANAKELEAIGREVENLGRRVSDREDELLVSLEERGRVDERAKEAQARMDELRAEVDRVAGESSAELTDLGGQLESLTGERAQLAGQLDPELVELYEDVRSHKKGVGAVALVDGVCQGCHETLSAVELDRVRRDQGIPRCEHCRRILVL